MKRILMIWVTLLLLFSVVLFLFIDGIRGDVLENRIMKYNSCISWEKVPKKVWYTNHTFEDYSYFRGEVNDENTEWSYRDTKGEEQKLQFISDYEHEHLYSMVTYDFLYKNNSIDINK